MSDGNNPGVRGQGGTIFDTDAITEKSGYGTPRYGKETRPTNFTYVLWKRIN